MSPLVMLLCIKIRYRDCLNVLWRLLSSTRLLLLMPMPWLMELSFAAPKTSQQDLLLPVGRGGGGNEWWQEDCWLAIWLAIFLRRTVNRSNLL